MWIIHWLLSQSDLGPTVEQTDMRRHVVTHHKL
jgi:hypothetical protein